MGKWSEWRGTLSVSLVFPVPLYEIWGHSSTSCHHSSQVSNVLRKRKYDGLHFAPCIGLNTLHVMRVQLCRGWVPTLECLDNVCREALSIPSNVLRKALVWWKSLKFTCNVLAGKLTKCYKQKYSYLSTSNADHDSYLCASVWPLKEAKLVFYFV